MASKRKGQTDKLTGGALPGWESQIQQSHPPAAKEEERPSWNYKGPDAPNKVVRKTYLVTNELKDRIAHVAEQNSVGPNELVRFLLTAALDQLDAGTLALPVVQKNTLDF